MSFEETAGRDCGEQVQGLPVTGGCQWDGYEAVCCVCVGLLREGHQPTVGAPRGTAAAEQGFSSQLGETASGGSQEQVCLSGNIHRGGCVPGRLLVAKERCDEQPVCLSFCEAEFPQRNSVNPNIHRLEANCVCIYISATEGRRG